MPCRARRRRGCPGGRQGVADPVGVLVVQEPLPPVARDPLREEDDGHDVGIAVRGHLEVPDERLDELAVGRLDEHEARRPAPGARTRSPQALARPPGRRSRGRRRRRRTSSAANLSAWIDVAPHVLERDDDALRRRAGGPDDDVRAGRAAPSLRARYSRWMNSMTTTRIGTMMMTIQAPSPNFAMAKTTATMPVATAPQAVDDRAPPPAPGPARQPVADHARLGQGERGEHADRVQRDQRLDRPPEGDDDDDRDEGQGDDPGVEREALAAKGELAGHEPVAGEDRGEPREVGEARLRRQDEDAHRRDEEDVVDRAPGRRPPRRSARGPRRAAIGTAPLTVARYEIPRKTTPRMTAIATIVVWAFFHSGGLNAGVPFEIASVPVIALQPSAKARMSSSRLRLSTGTCDRGRRR